MFKKKKKRNCGLDIQWNAIYSAFKMKEILPFTTMCMDSEDSTLNEINQTQKTKEKKKKKKKNVHDPIHM